MVHYNTEQVYLGIITNSDDASRNFMTEQRGILFISYPNVRTQFAYFSLSFVSLEKTTKYVGSGVELSYVNKVEGGEGWRE